MPKTVTRHEKLSVRGRLGLSLYCASTATVFDAETGPSLDGSQRR